MTAADVLLRMRVMLTRRWAWITGRDCRWQTDRPRHRGTERKWCLYGAWVHVEGDSPGYFEALHYLDRACGLPPRWLRPQWLAQYRSVAHYRANDELRAWNDAHTKPQVLAALDVAIALAEDVAVAAEVMAAIR